MPNPENVIGKGNRWQKGQSGNPKGRPKKLPDLHDAFVEILSEEKKDKNALEHVLAKLRSEALNGNIRAIELLLRYAYPNGIETVKNDDIEIVWGRLGKDKKDESEH